MYKRKGNHIITLKTEHKAVIDACQKVEKLGGEVTYLDVQADGRVDSNIYFTSTAPDVRLALSDLTVDDIIRITSNTVFGLLQGAVFGPFLVTQPTVF